MFVGSIVASVIGAVVGWGIFRWGYRTGLKCAESILKRRLAELDERNKLCDEQEKLIEEVQRKLGKITGTSSEDPYRAKLAVVQEEPAKVYCKDCKFLSFEFPGIEQGPFCLHGPWTEDPVRGKHRKPRDTTANENYDCPDFTLKKPKRPPATPPGPLPPPRKVLE